MSHIDCRSLTLDNDTMAEVLRLARRSPFTSTPLALLITEVQRASMAVDAVVVDGVVVGEYLVDVPVWTDGGPQWPARPRPTAAPVVDLATARMLRAKHLQSEIRAYVDGFAGPEDREIAIGVTLKVLRGDDVEPARAAAAAAMEAFTDRAQAEGERVGSACLAATTAEALDAITVDFDAVGVCEVGSVAALRGVTA